MLFPLHLDRQMIPWTIFALLLLDRHIIHVHIEFDSCHIFMPQEFLQTKGIIPQNQVANSKGVPENVRTDAFIRDSSPFTNPFEKHLYTILGQRGTCFSEKKMILTR